MGFDSIKSRIADQILGRLLPAVFILMFLNAIVVIIFSWGQWFRIVIPALSSVLLIPPIIMHRRKKLELSALLFISGVVLSITAGLIFSGGIYAPIYIGILVMPAFVTIIFNLKRGIQFSVILLFLGGHLYSSRSVELFPLYNLLVRPIY